MHSNRFAGALPDGGMRGMLGVIFLFFSQNLFAGALPEGGMRGMSILSVFDVHGNRLAGMLGGEAVAYLYMSENFFAGTVAESLPCSYTRASLV
eukprot:6134367-Amphidinium_carterae.1